MNAGNPEKGSRLAFHLQQEVVVKQMPIRALRAPGRKGGVAGFCGATVRLLEMQWTRALQLSSCTNKFSRVAGFQGNRVTTSQRLRPCYLATLKYLVMPARRPHVGSRAIFLTGSRNHPGVSDFLVGWRQAVGN